MSQKPTAHWCTRGNSQDYPPKYLHQYLPLSLWCQYFNIASHGVLKLDNLISLWTKTLLSRFSFHLSTPRSGSTKILGFETKRPLDHCGLLEWILMILREFSSCPVAKSVLPLHRTQVWSLGLEEGMATYTVFLLGESPWTEEPAGLQSVGLQTVRHGSATKHTQTRKHTGP